MNFKNKCDEIALILKKNHFLSEQVITNAYEARKLPTMPRRTRIVLSLNDDVKSSVFIGGGVQRTYTVLMRVYLPVNADENDAQHVFACICEAFENCRDVLSVTRDQTVWESNVDRAFFNAKAEFDEVLTDEK